MRACIPWALAWLARCEPEDIERALRQVSPRLRRKFRIRGVREYEFVDALVHLGLRPASAWPRPRYMQEVTHTGSYLVANREHAVAVVNGRAWDNGLWLPKNGAPVTVLGRKRAFVCLRLTP